MWRGKGWKRKCKWWLRALELSCLGALSFLIAFHSSCWTQTWRWVPLEGTKRRKPNAAWWKAGCQVRLRHDTSYFHCIHLQWSTITALNRGIVEWYRSPEARWNWPIAWWFVPRSALMSSATPVSWRWKQWWLWLQLFAWPRDRLIRRVAHALSKSSVYLDLSGCHL